MKLIEKGSQAISLILKPTSNELYDKSTIETQEELYKNRKNSINYFLFIR